MRNGTRRQSCAGLAALTLCATTVALGQRSDSRLGVEVAIPVHLQNGEEFNTPVSELIRYGSQTPSGDDSSDER